MAYARHGLELRVLGLGSVCSPAFTFEGRFSPHTLMIPKGFERCGYTKTRPNAWHCGDHLFLTLGLYLKP